MDPNNTPNPQSNPNQPGTVFTPEGQQGYTAQPIAVDQMQASAIASTPALVQPPMQPAVDPLLYATSPVAPPYGQVYASQSYEPEAAVVYENQDKSYVIALVLSLFLSGFAADRFYLGRTKTAVIKLLTFGALGIWAILDFYNIARGRLTARDDNRPLSGFSQNYHWAGLASKILVGFYALVYAGLVILLLLGVRASMAEQSKLKDYNTSVKNQSLNYDADSTVQ